MKSNLEFPHKSQCQFFKKTLRNIEQIIWNRGGNWIDEQGEEGYEKQVNAVGGRRKQNKLEMKMSNLGKSSSG